MTALVCCAPRGKLACAFIGARIGAIGTVWLTEGFDLGWKSPGATPPPLPAALVLLPLIGVALNGTSSVLLRFGTEPSSAATALHARLHAVFKLVPGTIGSGAIAPALYGLVGDAFGVWKALTLVAVMVLLTLPLAALLRPALPRGYGSEMA